MFEATNYISEYNVGDKFISFQYTNGKRFAQINVCQNKKVERNKKKIEVYQEGKAPLSLSFSTEDEAIEAFDLLNTTLDTLRTNCQTANAVVTLFPNGRENVTESRDFRDSDIDKLLIVIGNDITLTMPDSIVFSEQGRTIGLKFLQGYTGCGYQAAHGFTTKVLQLPNDGEFITLITGEYLGKSSVGSIANMQVNSDGDFKQIPIRQSKCKWWFSNNNRYFWKYALFKWFFKHWTRRHNNRSKHIPRRFCR